MALINFLEIIGTIAFAISGAIVGIQRKLDIFGITFMAVTTAVGGGIFRDLIIGNIPPNAFKDPTFSLIAMGCAFLTCFFYNVICKFKLSIVLSDAIGLGVFTAIGSNAALNNGINGTFAVIVMGLLTGVGGGILRDVFTKNIPFVFRKEIYAVACIIGSIVFCIIYPFTSRVIALYVTFIITFSVRILSVKYDLNLPGATKEITMSNEMADA
ncbi:trimeric intracellular cation channel family protein [Clostridium hydrogeniformans]|uniref:trimeric intracellular cation channel family protein n=1 Tax=Clostridium hydrogeniformans TaxID=349933 RepID=UPI00048A40F1|nr:trimeric intracellular cation channel family protein [Clostridium hydrogeniformans]